LLRNKIFTIGFLKELIKSRIIPFFSAFIDYSSYIYTSIRQEKQPKLFYSINCSSVWIQNPYHL